MSITGSYGIFLDYTNDKVDPPHETLGSSPEIVPQNLFPSDVINPNVITESFSTTRTLVATTTTLDLSSLYRTGSQTSFNLVKLFYIQNKSTTNNLTIGGAGSNAWGGPWGTGTKTLLPGQVHFEYCMGSGWIVDGTHKNLLIDSGANTVAFDVVLMGA